MGVGDFQSKYSLSASVDEGSGRTSETGKILPNGDFVFDGLPPGKHFLTLLAPGANGFQTIGKAEVNLASEDLTGVVITPFKPAQVRVRVVLEGEEDKPLTSGSVFLIPKHWDGYGRGSWMQYQPQNGIYVIEDVPPDKYRIWFNNVSDCYLKSVESGGRMLDPESIQVGDGAVLDLLMIFSRNVASLSGDVEVPQDQSKHSARALLISEDADGSPELRYRWPTLDQSAHFSIARLRPGKYLAFATQ